MLSPRLLGDLESSFDPQNGRRLSTARWVNPFSFFRCRLLANPPRRSRIAVITWSNRTYDYRPVEQVVCGYCVRHGYDRVLGESLYDTPLPLNGVQWQRIPFILDTLQHYEAVLHLDDDSVINHLEYPMERLLAAYPDREFLLTAVETRGRSFQGSPKSSTMVIRNTTFVLQFLHSFLTDSRCAHFRNSSTCCREQDCLWRLMSQSSKYTYKADGRFGVLSSADMDCRDETSGPGLFHSRIHRGSCSSPFVYHAIGTPGWYKWKYVYRKASALMPIASRSDWMAGSISLQTNATHFSSGRLTPQLLSAIAPNSTKRKRRKGR